MRPSTVHTLDGKDRDQLSQIASALGVKATSRMRKADLVDAIVGAAANGDSRSSAANGGGPGHAAQDPIEPCRRRRRHRHDRRGTELSRRLRRIRRRHDVDPPAPARRDRQRRLATAGVPSRPTSPRPRLSTSQLRAGAIPRRETIGRNERANGATSESDGPQDRDAPDHADGTDHADHDHDGDSGSGDRNGAQQQWRDDDSSANKRRRRRRGRDRERAPGEARAPRGDGRPERVDRGGDEYNGDLVEIEGLLDLRDEGYGFLRASGYLAGRNDAYVSASQVRRFGLRKGDHVKGATRPPASSEKYPALVRVDLINDVSIDEARHRVRFEDLTPLFPDSRLKLELPDNPGEITGRIIDLIAPIGKGQRGMIVSPPKAGQDDDHQADRLLDRAQQPRVPRHRAPGRRASRRGHRHAPARAARRRRRVHVRPAVRRALPHRRADHRAGQAPRRVRQGRRDHPRRHHPPGARVQPRGAGIGPDHVGRHRRGRALPAEEVLRCGAQRRGGRIAHDPRHRARRDELEDGRAHLRGVQGHREHGAPPRPAHGRPAHLSRPSTSSSRAPATKSCSSTATTSSRCTSCAGCWAPSRARPGSSCSSTSSAARRATPSS